MEALGRLIDELRAGGDLDSRGEFTLDRDRALEKMRQFQLSDPRSYVLELVQTAVLVGANEARFEIDADDMRMTFDGRPFTTRDFEDLYGSMFTRRSSPARRQLALGLNSAMALEPTILRVESGTARMEMRPGGDEITTAKDAVDGTRIHVKDRLSNATLVRFVLKLRGDITEMLYLKDRCRWTTLAIFLNGELISGEEPLAEADGRVQRSTPGTSIVAGFVREHQPARLMMLDQGVWIATHQLDSLPVQFVACVESTRLLKDASQRNVVLDRAYRSVLAEVSEAFYQALAKRIASAGLARHVLDRRIALGASGEKLFRQQLLHPATLPLIRRAGDTIQESGDGLLTADGDEYPDSHAVASVPLWPSARNPPLELSLLDLLHLRASHGRVGWTDAVHPDLERQDQPPVVVVSAEEERNYLAELFGDGFYCADSELQRELVRWRNVLRWQRRRMTPEIPTSAGLLISIPLATPEVNGEVGIFLDPFRQSEGPGRFPVWWIKDGCLLQKAVATPIVRGFTAALEADFEPTEDFARVEVDRLFVRVVVALARAIEPLMNRLAAESRALPGLPELIRSSLISYLGTDWNRDGLTDHLKGFGIADKKHLSYARRLVEEDPVATISAADLASEEAPALARVPLFATMSGQPPIVIGSDPGRRLTLRDIAQGDDNWRYLPRPHSGLRTSAEDDVLLLDDGEIATLRQVFPGVTLQNHSRDDHRPAALAPQTKQRPAIPPSGCVEEIHVEAGDIRGRFRLRYPSSPDRPVFTQLQLFKHDRRLDDLHFRLPIGPIAGRVNHDDPDPTQSWSGVENDAAVERIRSLVLKRITGLLLENCGPSLPPEGHRRRLLLNAATRVLATEAALEDWSLEDLLPSAVTQQNWAQELAAALETVPLFTDLDGRPVDLKQIRRELDHHDTLLFLLDRDASGPSPQEVRPRLDERLVLRLSHDDQDAVERIFGSYRVELASGGGQVELDTAREAPAWDDLPSREARLLRALHAELRHAGRGHVELLDDKNLDRIALDGSSGDSIASCLAGGVTVDRRQPLVGRLLAEPEIDPVQMAFLASTVYTAMNHFWLEIEDDHEREFHHALIQRLLDERPRSADARA